MITGQIMHLGPLMRLLLAGFGGMKGGKDEGYEHKYHYDLAISSFVCYHCFDNYCLL